MWKLNWKLLAKMNKYPRLDRWTKTCILSFLKQGDLGIPKNYRCITLTSIATKIYNALVCNGIELNIEKILWKNQIGFRRNRSTTSQILTIHRILEGNRAKPLRQQYYSSTCPSCNGGGVIGVMVIVVGNGHGDTSSNPEQDWLHFT